MWEINWTGSSKCVRADKSSSSHAHQFIQSREQVLGRIELHLKHARSNDAHAGGQGSGLPRFGRDRQLDLPGSPVPARSFQVLCQPNPAPDLIGKRLAALHAFERRDQILAANQKRAAGLVAAKLRAASGWRSGG